jgi:phosphohistidine swiveling domain-containing protein
MVLVYSVGQSLVRRRKFMSQARVVPLDVTQSIDRTAVGCKAMSLVRLNRIGLPVPPGFCVLGTAFREHLEANGLITRIESAVDELGVASPGARKSLLSDLRQAIIETPLAQHLCNEIEDRYRTLGADRVAVRSSATVEDLSGHSFAGQYDTYLGVAELADCLEAIKKCWASLWTERAYDYRERNGFDHLDADMAVIVQRLVPAEASGVLFTADPVTGRSDRLIIEACFGMGEALVSGKVTPDRFLLSKRDLRMLSHSASQKTIQSVLDDVGGVVEQAVDPGRAKTLCINETIARRLGALAKKAESALGSPQDMEWAVKGAEIFFLQSRPITTLPAAKSWEDQQVWTNANTGEVLPDVVTPMSWSMAGGLVMAIFNSVFGWIGLDFGDHPLIGQIAGRAYFNLNTLIGALRRFPGLRNMDMTRILGGEQGNMGNLGQLEIPEESIPDLSFSLARMMFKMPSFVFRVLSHSPKKGERFVTEMRERADELQGVDLHSLSEDELVAHLRNVVEDILGSVQAIAFAGLGMFYFSSLDKVSRKWLGDSEGTFANRLLAGMGGMDSAEAGLELWQLAVKAHESSAIEEIILSGDGWETTRERIAEVQGGDEFLLRWDEFSKAHGHHTRGELELFNARWSESPDYILDMARGYLSCFGKTDPVENHRQRAEERDELARQCRQRLRNPIKRGIFNFYLEQAQHGSVVRENLKSVAVRYWAALRFILLELGGRLVVRRVLESRGDIFFLSLEEIDPVRRGEAGFKVREVVAARRVEYERNLAIIPPKVVVGKFDPDNFVPDAVKESAELLAGLAVSPGVVTGPARVILRANTDEQVVPGEVLVAPFTDPGWTPYFLPAAAIVMDQGGLLSHGSIVAREYGIPAVVNVGPATRIIHTGQTIQVDGNSGVVRILR